jgi:ABC-type branched-subunit amino acid transport system substrate-binding protein
MGKIAVFYQNDSYGKAGLAGVTRALEARNLKPAALGTVERNTVAVGDAVAAIVKERPDAVVQISAYRSCAAFIREARRAGYGGTFYNVSFVGTKALADELGPDSRGVVVSQVVPYPFAAVTGLSREYLAASRTAGAEPNYSSMEGYLAAKVFCEGLKRMRGGNGAEAFVTALESIDTGFGGFNVSFGPRKHTGSTFVDLTMLAEYGKVRR